MTKPSKKLEQLALNALKAKQQADKAAEIAEECKFAFLQQLIAEDMFNPDTKAIGVVRTSISPNRYFDLDTAITIVPEEVVKECKVEIVDPKLLKQNMTPKQVEAAMKSYEVPFKIGLKVND
jgi:hypothetical protein